MRFDPERAVFESAGIVLGGLVPLIDGAPADIAGVEAAPAGLTWALQDGGALELSVSGTELTLRLTGLPPDREIDAFGLRFEVRGAARYFRNGYQSWDASYLVARGDPPPDDHPWRAPGKGFAVTAFLAADGGTTMLGFTRHDRFQTRFRYAWTDGGLQVDVEILWDRTPHDGVLHAEPLILFEADDLQAGLAAWSGAVAAASPRAPRIPERRLTGWCSWYNLYAAIDEPTILEHLAAAARFRDEHRVPLDIFLVDDGFTPEMGDWLEIKPQFPRGMDPLVADIAAAGFTPGLWIAPFMVGNRSRLFREHPDWVVRERATGEPLAQMKFYGEFRWHKRSEEYYVLDVTHPDAEAYIRRVFRTWRREWGCGYFKTDFMYFGAEHGPDRAVWHQPGLSRIAIWRRMGELIREEIEDALWLGCGCPLWASVGLVDAMRIGRDVGVVWKGDQSAESLLRDQVGRNHASGVLWQADPDCVLLRDRFHELTDDQVRSLALFAGLAGGVLMSSDKLDELPGDRAALFAALLNEPRLDCRFATGPKGVIVQEARRPDGSVVRNLFNTRGQAARVEGLELRPYESRLVLARGDPLAGLQP